MRILWLTESPSKYKTEKTGYNGRGWIESLQTLIETLPEIEQLGIAFSHHTDSKKFTQDKVIYYPIKKTKPKNRIAWVINNWRNSIDNVEETLQLREIIQDFNPDLLHIFGTESWLCYAVKMTNRPCVVHLQGILQPLVNNYIPFDISNSDLIKSNFGKFIKGYGPWHDKKNFEKSAFREYNYFKDILFYMGRTEWDKSISTFLSPSSVYFHVDEVLRDEFYSAPQWRKSKSNKIIITSTLSDSPYKGLDVIIKTAKLLIKEDVYFEWRIIGLNNLSTYVQIFETKFKKNCQDLNISLLGIKKAEEIINLLLDTSVYVHTSYIDNSPNSLCEALYLGVPSIATNVGGIPSLVDNGKDGLLVPSNDPFFLASKIEQLVHDDSLMTNISKQARARAEKRHSKKNIVNQLIEVYKSLFKLDSSNNLMNNTTQTQHI
jgi:glycosyltransferase involved in cell wall biosynthesis